MILQGTDLLQWQSILIGSQIMIGRKSAALSSVDLNAIQLPKSAQPGSDLFPLDLGSDHLGLDHLGLDHLRPRIGPP